MEPIDQLTTASSQLLQTPDNSKSNQVRKLEPLVSFGSLLDSAQTSRVAEDITPPKDEKVISEYTSIITNQFIGAILDEQSGLFDSGDGASAHYHSMMVQAVSDHLTQTDALGLKSLIQWEISKW